MPTFTIVTYIMTFPPTSPEHFLRDSCNVVSQAVALVCPKESWTHNCHIVRLFSQWAHQPRKMGKDTLFFLISRSLRRERGKIKFLFIIFKQLRKSFSGNAHRSILTHLMSSCVKLTTIISPANLYHLLPSKMCKPTSFLWP